MPSHFDPLSRSSVDHECGSAGWRCLRLSCGSAGLPTPNPPAMLAQYLAAEQQLGRVRMDVEPTRAAVTILATILGLAIMPDRNFSLTHRTLASRRTCSRPPPTFWPGACNDNTDPEVRGGAHDSSNRPQQRHYAAKGRPRKRLEVGRARGLLASLT